MNGDESSDGQGVVPLRTILINFLNLVETYEARRNGGLDSYDTEFQELKAFSETLKGDPDFMCKEGEKNVNRKKNRYKDILPFDYTRVILSDYGDVPGSDYINANFIKGASGSSAYIASQGPLPHTVNDFWRMVVECEVQVIVMACNEQESGKHKCENYWVEEDPEEREFGEVTVWLKKCRQVCPDFLVRTMRIRFTNSRGEKEERNVCQFHYSAWPDHGVPTKVRPLLDMVRLIRDRQTSETLPVLVHCSAGCGRTGTICAIDYVWGLLRLGRLTKDFSLFTLVREMRKQRIAMVQTKDQYILVHRAVKELFQEQLKIIDSHPYANVDHEGLPFDLKRELEEPTYEVLDFTKGLVNNSARLSDYADISGNINNNNHITVSVSNINLNPKSSPPPLPPPCLLSKTSPPISSLSSSGETVSSSTPPATVDKADHGGKRDHHRQPEKNSRSEQKNKHPVKSKASETDTNTTDEKRVVVVAVLEKKNSSGSDSEIPKSNSSTNLRSALLRKPSIVKLKSFFERNPSSSKDEKKPGQLSRAKSDVSSMFYNFTAFGQSRNNAGDGKGNEGKSSLTGGGSNNSKGDPTPKKPPISTKPTIPIKRSKSFKITHHDPSPLVPIVNHMPKSRKKSNDDSNPNASSSTTTPSSSSYTISSSSSSSPSPIKVCVKQVEIPKLQAVLSKSIKPEMAQIATTTTATHEYDYDIDDRSHLRQKPISPSVLLQREALQKSSTTKTSPPETGSSSSKGTTKPSKSSKALVKPEPPSRIHILKDNRSNDYANVISFGKNGPRKPSEMEDILPSKSSSSNQAKYEKLKKCDTVNPRILAASYGLTSNKHERSSLTRSQSHVWQPDKTQIPIRIFSDENLHQSSSPSFPLEKRSDCNINEPLKPADSSEIFIQAIHPEVKSLSSSEYHRKEQDAVEASSTTTTTPPTTTTTAAAALPVNGSKPVQRRRVPKTNPYANYPACITGSNTSFPYKLPQPVEDSDSYPVNHNSDSHHHHNHHQQNHIQRTGVSNIPSLRQSHTGGGSVGNSSDSSSNTGTPRNSSPGTPTQSVDMSYPKLYRNPPTVRTSSTPQHSNDNSISRTNNNNNGIPINQPKSILKESPGSTPSESEEKLDSPRGFPPTPSSSSSTTTTSTNLPKMNTIRIAVGLRERRNSFRQAVWKEAQPASPGNSTEGAQGSKGNYPGDFSRNLNPFNPNFQGDTAGKIHKNYEPIWPDPNNCNNGTSMSNGNPFYIPSFSGNKSDATSSSNPFANLTSTSSQASSKKMLMSNGKSNDGFHSKMDQIKVMLAELNAPVMSSAESKTEQPTGASTLKQQRSLRAPSRSHYQHGLSCFPFRKPSSYESIVDQLQHEENLPSKNNNCSSEGASGRTGNDYVTLEQCRTADSKGPSANGFPTGVSSPEFGRAGHQQQSTSPSTTPVPPPRTRKNHYNNPNPDSSTYPDLSPDSNGFWPPSTSNSNYSHLPPITIANQNGRSSEPRDEYTNSHHHHHHNEMNQNDNKTSSGTSPKAIIRALGLVQAKAANVRSRWANRGGSKERLGSSKRPLENGTGSSMESSTEEQPNHSRFHEPLCAPLLQTPTSQLASTGLVQRSKHQYL